MEADSNFQTQPTIVVETFPLKYEEFKPLLSNKQALNLIVETSSTGKSLRKPVTVTLPYITNKRDLDVTNYVIESLVANYPNLIPFTLNNKSVFKLATHLRRHKTSSKGTLKVYIYCFNRFCKWLNKTPDKLVAECADGDNINSKVVRRLSETLDDYVGELEASGLAPSTINVNIHSIKTFLKSNRIPIPQVLKPRIRVVYSDRSPTPEELSNLLNFADLREKVVISMLALGGFRVGTLCQLKYRHVQHDLEYRVRPVHVHIEAEIVKGKSCDYDTFIGSEAVEFLMDYLNLRKRGSPDGSIPPETITDESPLIRTKSHREPKSLTRDQLSRVIRRLYVKAGLVTLKRVKRYGIRAHSIRKYFKTQLTALGVPTDYIEYMMGHKISTYQDVKMKGIEFLRNIYVASNLSIRPRTKMTRATMLKEIIRAWGYDPEKVLITEALAEPHRTICAEPSKIEDNEIKLLSNALKDMLRKELLDIKKTKETQPVYGPPVTNK